MVSLGSSHAGMYALPFNWVNSRFRPNASEPNITYTEKPSRCEDFFHKLLIPITSPIAVIVGVLMFVIGVMVLGVSLPFLLLTCCCCICCSGSGEAVVAFLLVMGVLIIGGFVVVIYAIILFVFWPFLVIIYGLRACFGGCCCD